MIVEEGKHYLYRHIRLDNNQVFYVGIGTKYDYAKDEYKRANIKRNRNNLWKAVINKTDYRVDILLESDDYVFIKEKEKEFIALYGRKNLGTGTLVNLTDGGDGSIGFICKSETREKLSKINSGENHPNYGKSSFMLGKKHTEEAKKKMSEKAIGRIMPQETREKLKVSMKGKKTALGRPMSDYVKEKLNISKYKKCIFTNIETNEIKEFDNIRDGANYFNLHQSLCSKVLSGLRNHTGGYKIEYKNN